jgi:hypothetical protein
VLTAVSHFDNSHGGLVLAHAELINAEWNWHRHHHSGSPADSIFPW